jgi:hypothetical protein
MESRQTEEKVTSSSSPTTIDSVALTAPAPAAPAANNYTGEYIWQEDPQGYYQTVSIAQAATGEYNVRFSASAVKGKPGCSFEGKGTIVNDTLKIPVAWRDGTVTMTIIARNDTVDVFTQNFEDRFALNYYCSGGGSLAGEYYKKQQ